MYCKCSSGNNFKVVGLCDSSVYNTNEKESWIQITVPEILTLPSCYPDMEDIERIYIKVLIEDTRVVETPKSDGKNIEGNNLTGVKLIVDGSICQTIVYTADNCEQSLHAVNFKYPFCTSIVLPEDTNIESDKFCVDTCVENVYAKALNPRTIFKSVSLFLLAEKAKVLCPATNKVTGTITNQTADTVTVEVVVINSETNETAAIQLVTVGPNYSENYEILGLCNETYKVNFIVPQGYIATPNTVGPQEVPPNLVANTTITKETP